MLRRMERLADFTRTISSLPKVTAFTRMCIAVALGGGSLGKAVMVAQSRWPQMSHLADVLTKTAVAVGTTDDPTWAAPLSPYQTIADEWVEALRPSTILGKLSGVTP